MRKCVFRYVMMGIAVCLTAAMLLIGCGKNGDTVSQNAAGNLSANGAAEVMNVSGNSVSMADYYVYLIQYLYNYGIRPEQLDADTSYSLLVTATNDLKDEMVRKNLVEEAGLSATEAQQQTIEQMLAAFYGTFGEDFLSSYGIDEATVRAMIARQLDTYLLSMKTQQDIQAEYTAQYKEEYGETNFHEMYYVLFPTYQVTEEGQLVLDEEGNPQLMEEEELKEQLRLAEEFRTRAVEGLTGGENVDSMESLADEYGLMQYCGIQRNFDGTYVEEINQIIESLADGEISDVFETDAGYMIIRMDRVNNEEYKELAIEQAAAQKAESEWENRVQSMIAEAGIDGIQPNEELLGTIDVTALCNDMISRGLVFDQSLLNGQ